MPVYATSFSRKQLAENTFGVSPVVNNHCDRLSSGMKEKVRAAFTTRLSNLREQNNFVDRMVTRTAPNKS